MIFSIFQNVNSSTALIGSFIAGAFLTANIGAKANDIGRALGVIDEPCGLGGHKHHASPTPAVGGVIALLVSLIVLLVTIPFSNPENISGRSDRLWSAFAITLVMIVGFFDDRSHISAIKRLAADIVIFSGLLWLVPVLQFTRLSFSSLGLQLDITQFGFTISLICLVGLKNAVNMADGRNGLVLGLAIVWSAFFISHSPAHALPVIAGLTGVFAVLFTLNVQGRLFLGDCGSHGIGTLFGILALAMHNIPAGGMSSAEGVLLFMIPVMDTLRLAVQRIAIGRSPFSPDRQHLHHLLEAAFGWRFGWAIYMMLVAIPLISYQIAHQFGYQIILTVLISYIMLVKILVQSQKRKNQTTDRVDLVDAAE